jgi:hypothetical protein
MWFRVPSLRIADGHQRQSGATHLCICLSGPRR